MYTALGAEANELWPNTGAFMNLVEEIRVSRSRTALRGAHPSLHVAADPAHVVCDTSSQRPSPSVRVHVAVNSEESVHDAATVRGFDPVKAAASRLVLQHDFPAGRNRFGRIANGWLPLRTGVELWTSK